MKNLIIALLTTLFISGCENDNVELTKEQYKQLIGDTIKPEYPKRIYIINHPEHTDEYFNVYLGSDSHEYQRHRESHTNDQWVHYGNCKLCKKDTL